MPFRPTEQRPFPSLGWDLGRHIEQYLGIELMDEQAERLIRLYRLDLNGHRVVRRAGLRRPKGAGKSPEGGYVGFGELTGPVVFSHWDDDGQPIGRLHPNPWIQFAAVSEDQTDNVLVWLFDTLADQPDALAELHIDLGRTRIYLRHRPGRIEPVTAAAGSREGQPVSFAVLDQSEAWKKENGGLRLAAVLRRNAGKTGGWTYELQNAPEPGDGSVADATARAWEKGQSGILFDTREPTKVPALDDRPALLSSLREVYGESATRGYVNPERLADECTDADTEPSDAYRFYLNLSRPAETRAFDVIRWAELKRLEPLVYAGATKREYVTAGFDGSKFHDSTGLIGTHVETGYQWVAGAWERPTGVREDDWEVDDADVEAKVVELFDTWRVWRLYGDPPYWEEAMDRWVGKWGARKVVKWWTNRNRQMAYALKAYREAMMDGSLSHDGSPVFARHIANARKAETTVKDEEGRFMWVIRKEGPKSPLKIDLAMAGCLSWEARGDAIASGLLKRVHSGSGVSF